MTCTYVEYVICNIIQLKLTDGAEEIACHLKKSHVVFPKQHLPLVGQSVGQQGGAEPQHKTHVLHIPTCEPRAVLK